MRKIVISFIKAYKLLLSPFLGQNCRFHPGCANYAVAAVEHHGVIKGGYLGVRRILKCHPWNQGGHDPVPEQFSFCGTADITAPDSVKHLDRPASQ